MPVLFALTIELADGKHDFRKLIEQFHLLIRNLVAVLRQAQRLAGEHAHAAHRVIHRHEDALQRANAVPRCPQQGRDLRGLPTRLRRAQQGIDAILRTTHRLACVADDGGVLLADAIGDVGKNARGNL